MPNQTQDDASSSGEPATTLDAQQKRLRAAAELREQEHQRILRVIPNFNTSEIENAEPLSPGQKFELAARSEFDPFTFLATGLDAAWSQHANYFPEYGQGAQGYAKRFGASYTDSFSSTMIGNALLPVLLKQDPRYFRKGTGSFGNRLWYALMSTVECKNDNGKWAPNYSNMLGNIAAGGISNLYYPPSGRGVALTFERAADVSIEGAAGSAFAEFWPDISRKMFKHRADHTP